MVADILEWINSNGIASVIILMVVVLWRMLKG